MWIYGINPVKEFLLKGKIQQIAVTKKLYDRLNKDRDFAVLLNGHKIKIIEKFEKFLPMGVNHQNIAALIDAPKKLTYNDFIHQRSEVKKIVILDQITDIGNVGNIIRSAIAFGIKDLFVPEYNSAENYAAIAKSSSGMLVNMNIYSVPNLNKLIFSLKAQEFWCVGLDGHANSELRDLKKFEKIAIIVGSEGRGVRNLVKKNCDLLVKVPMSPDAESLNAANAASIVFYELFCKK